MSFLKGRNTVTRADKIADFMVNTAEYGATVPEILGTTRISGNVIYYDDFTSHEHRETHKTGKGGRSKQTNITYTYTVACLLGLCEGPISGIGKVWRGKDVYTYPADEIQLTMFSGADGQAPWAYTVGKHPEKALAYEGLAYMAGVIDLGESGSMPSFNFEVKGKLLSTGDGIDVNPADYIRYILDKVGLSDVEITGLDNYRAYCREADLLISSPGDTEARSARDIINEIAELTNAYMFWSNDRFKIIPLSDRPVGDWTPNRTITYALTAEDFIPQSDGALVVYERKDSSELYNRFPVEFTNRANGYEKESVSYELSDDIRNYGLRTANKKTAKYIYTKDRAVKIAEQWARNSLYGRNKYTFKLDWAFCRIEVGDLVTLTDDNVGVDHQVAIVDSVVEGEDGLLTITAISRANGEYSAPQYDVHANSRPYIDFNQAPSNTVPTIFQPPADLTSAGLELWIAAKGTANTWGGCYVYVSDDDLNYRECGQISNSARCGKLITPTTADSTTVVVSCNDQLISGTQQDAERKNTLCWINGECFSYVTAQMQSDGNWILGGCLRGQYNTVTKQHSAGADFVRLDAAVLRLDFTKEDIGKKLYLKFPAYNIFGSGEQDLSSVQAYEYTLQPYYIPPVTNLRLRSRYREQIDRKSLYDVVVAWELPVLQSYLQGDVWYKIKKATDTNFDTKWTFGGSGKSEVVIPQAVAGDTYRIAVCTKDTWGAVTNPDTSPQSEILVTLKSEIPTAPEGFTLIFGNTCVASWKEVSNADIAYYELRYDTNPGVEDQSLIAKTNSISYVVPLTNRNGKLYLYAKATTGVYSSPATITYNVPVPPVPDTPELSASIGGFSVRTQAIPENCAGIAIYIDGTILDKVKTNNNIYSYSCAPGLYDVSVAFFDFIGEGQKSEESRVEVKMYIDPALIKEGSLTAKMLDEATNTALEKANQAMSEIANLQTLNAEITNTVSGINTETQNIITELNKAPDQNGYRAIHDLVNTDTELANTIATNKATQDGVNTTNATKIQQNTNSISALVTKTDATNATVASHTSSISQQAASITAIVQKNTGQDTEISQIKQTASGLASTVQSVQTTANTAKSTADAAATKANTATSTANTANTNASNALSKANAASTSAQQAVTKASQVEQTVNGLTTTVQQTTSALDAYSRAVMEMAHGKLITQDPCFKNAVNIYSYDNSGSSNTLLTPVALVAGDPPTGGRKVLVKHNWNGSSSPGNGGFVNARSLSHRGRILLRFVAKLPADSRFRTASNALGAGGSHGFITSNLGTGKWQEYIAYWQYGDSGNISTCGYIYCEKLNGSKVTTVGTLLFEVSSAEYYDVSQYQLVPDVVQSQITQTANSVTSIVANLSKAPGSTGYSAITQLNNAMQLKVEKSGVIAAINLSPSTVKIAGKYVQIDGNTQFTNNVIVNRMLAANAVTADKMSVGSLSAITANVGSLSGGTITGTTLVGSTIKNSTNTFSVDANGNIKGATIVSGTINASMIMQAGYKIKETTIITGTLNHKGIVPLPAGYTEDQCLWFVYKLNSEINNDLLYEEYKCFTTKERMLICGKYLNGKFHGSKAQYRVIGIR